MHFHSRFLENKYAVYLRTLHSSDFGGVSKVFSLVRSYAVLF